MESNIYKLSDITLKISKGSTPRGKVIYDKNEKNLFLRVSDIEDFKEIEDCEYSLSDEDFSRNKMKNWPVNTIILSIEGTIGKVAILKKELCFNQAVAGIVPNTELVDPYYLMYYLKTPNVFKNIVKGTIMPSIRLNDLSELEVVLPSLEKQKEAVKALKSISEKEYCNISIQKKLFKIGELIYKKEFETNENIPYIKLKNVVENSRERINVDEDYRVLSAVNTGDLVFSDDYFEKQVYSKDLTKYLKVKKNYFAYNPARINIGSIGINKYDYNCCVSPVYVVIKTDNEYINFFNYYFKSILFNNEVKMRASGSVRQTLNFKDFAEIEIRYPSLEQIKQFNIVCDKINYINDVLKKENYDLNNMRTILINEMFEV